jgi:hypothetical protein
MPQATHTKAAAHHENAAKSHRAAAEHHGKGDQAAAHQQSTRALEHSSRAHQYSGEAYEKSTAKKSRQSVPERQSAALGRCLSPSVIDWRARPLSQHLSDLEIPGVHDEFEHPT